MRSAEREHGRPTDYEGRFAGKKTDLCHLGAPISRLFVKTSDDIVTITSQHLENSLADLPAFLQVGLGKGYGEARSPRRMFKMP